MGTATRTQEKLQTFRADWQRTLALLKELNESESLNFGELLATGLDALDAGLSIMAQLEVIEKMNFKLSGWADSGRAASIIYTLKKEYNETTEHTQTTIHKESILTEQI